MLCPSPVRSLTLKSSEGQRACQAVLFSGSQRVEQRFLGHRIPASRNSRTPLRCSAEDKGSENQGDLEKNRHGHTYVGADGRFKATMEQAFKIGAPGPKSPGPGTPWGVGWQMNEKHLAWNDDLKFRLKKRIVADTLGLGDEELDARLLQLQSILPNLVQKWPQMKPELLAALAANPGEVTIAMIRLKEIFPDADVGRLVGARPSLILSEAIEETAASAQFLRETFPKVSIDRLVELNPSALDVTSFMALVKDAKRVLPSLSITKVLNTDPTFVNQFQKGKEMIPYDD